MGAALGQCLELTHAPRLLAVGREVKNTAEVLIWARLGEVDPVLLPCGMTVLQEFVLVVSISIGAAVE